MGSKGTRANKNIGATALQQTPEHKVAGGQGGGGKGTQLFL